MDLGRRTKPLLVYGHGEAPGCGKLGYLDFAIGSTYDRDSVLDLGPFSFRFTPTVHPDPCFAIRASCGGASLVYTGDTAPTPGLDGFAAGVDLLLCEASLYDDYRGKIPGHMSAGEAGELATASGARTLVLTHLPHYGDHALLLLQARAVFGGTAMLARGGLVLKL